MEDQEKIKRYSPARIRSLIITVAICLLLVVSVITFVSKLAQYNELKEREKQLLREICAYKDRIEELEYWIDAPMDDDYIMKFAREKLDLFRADDVVYTNDQDE